MARVSTLKGVLGAAGVIGFASIMSIATPVRANPAPAVLYTTADDWGQGSLGSETVWDSDGSTTDGLGNNVVQGATGTAGSAEYDFDRILPLGYGEIDDLSSHNYDQAFFDVIDPGSTANNTSVAHSGDFYLTYTLPADATGSYFYLGIQ